jgi:hypothetical protein
MRRLNYQDYPTYNYQKTLDKINSDTETLLQEIQDWAKQHNQTIIILGGQSTLNVELFNKPNKLDNIHLLTPCVMTEICKLYDKNASTFGLFKLADFTDKLDETWDKQLVHKIYEDIDCWDKSILRKHFTWPDTGHLNCTASLILTDLLFEKLEQLNII